MGYNKMLLLLCLSVIDKFFLLNAAFHSKNGVGLGVATAKNMASITYITENQIRDIGGQVDLQCSVPHALENNIPFLWVKYGRENTTESYPLSLDSFLIIRDQGYSLSFDSVSETYTLSIHGIKEIDAGRYQCRLVPRVNEMITADVELQVRVPYNTSDNSTFYEVVGAES